MTEPLSNGGIDLDTIVLKPGKHASIAEGGCVMEIVSYVAGEPWSDHPECVCPALGAFARAWNDGLPDDATRTRILAPFIPRLVGTRSTPEVQDARAFMAADWAVRMYTPAWLRLAGLDEDAAALESLTGLSSIKLCKAAMPVIGAVEVSRTFARRRLPPRPNTATTQEQPQ